MKRPRINIEPEPIDRSIEWIGGIALIILIVLPVYYYPELPEQIPVHFGIDGNPDGFGGKGWVFILPVIGVIMHGGLYWLNKHPHTFNYPQKITPQNARQQYLIATRLIRTINTIITVAFAIITHAMIQTALGYQKGIGIYFTPVFLVIIFGTVFYFLTQSKAKKSS